MNPGKCEELEVENHYLQILQSHSLSFIILSPKVSSFKLLPQPPSRPFHGLVTWSTLERVISRLAPSLSCHSCSKFAFHSHQNSSPFSQVLSGFSSKILPSSCVPTISEYFDPNPPSRFFCSHMCLLYRCS